MEVFKRNLKNFNINLNEFEFGINEGEHAIDEYSRELIRQVQLATEIKIQRLEKEIESVKEHSSLVIKYIEDHKKKVIDKYQKKKSPSCKSPSKRRLFSRLEEFQIFSPNIKFKNIKNFNFSPDIQFQKIIKN